MAAPTVDLVATGPPPFDPYDPDSAAWALARAFAARGDRVNVLYPAGPTGDAPPPGTTAIPIAVPLRRPGALIEAADFAAAAGRTLRPDAEIVVRDPSGLGPLGLGRDRPYLASFVRSIALHEFDAERGARPVAGFADRVDAWRDRRAVRRLERMALEEPDALFCDRPELGSTLAREYGIAEGRLRPTVPPVPLLPAVASREEARAAFGIPPDVPVAVAAAPDPRPEPSGFELVREAFRRVRSFFPGARLVLVGAASPAEPGVVVTPSRAASAFAAGFVAADVALFTRRSPGFDPGVVFAMRAGVAPIVAPSVTFPVDPGPAVRRAVSDDAGNVASALAELLADPALCREVSARGKAFAAAFDPAAIVRSIGPARVPA